MSGDEDWFGRLRGGKEASEHVYSELFLRYFPRLRKVFERKGWSRADAEDLAQETFLRVCRGLHEFRGEAQFGSWIHTIAHNVERELGRRRLTLKRKHQEVPLEEWSQGDASTTLTGEWLPPASDIPSPQRQLLTKEMEERALCALEELPDQMRRCFLLRFGQDLEYQDIAAVMQISIQTVKSHLHQARQRLKSLLAEDLPP